MNPERFQQIEELYHAALGSAPEARATLLAEADAELRREVESLLAQATVDDPLSHPAVEAAAGLLEEGASALPAAIGQYRIIAKIGEGGMGVVYEAEQEQPRRRVALKVIKPGWSNPELVRRFQQESQALGRLQHPGIAQIYEAGTADTGFGPQPYFAMEFIQGQSLRRYAEAHHLNTRQRLEIMAKIAEAVHHAHQRGIIHRDLKPGNVLVDETGQPKILDFGVARITDSDAQATLKTDLGQLVGTLAYMSPEQVLADPLELDTRSDVYALGVILYELLARRLPYHISPKLHEAVRAIREEDPARLSSISRNYRGDIETIVAKALEKDKARRYGSAAALAADIQRYLHDEPITARPASTTYQLQKFARRHKALVAGVAAVFVVLVGGIGASTWEAVRARRAEQSAVAAEQTAQAVNDFLQNDLLAQASASNQARPDTKPNPDLKVRTALDRAAAKIEGKFARQPLVEASIRQTIGTTYLDLGLYVEAGWQLERALDLRRRVLGGEAPETLISMDALALVYLRQGKYAQAEPVLTKVVAVRRRLLGEEHPDTLRSMDDFSELYWRLGKYAQAEPLVSKVLEVERRVLGEHHPTTLGTASDLAQLYQAQHKAQAEPLFIQVLEQRRRFLGEEHPDTLSSENNLANFYLSEGMYGQAEPLFTKVLDVQRRVLGEEHPYTLISVNNLAVLHRDQGKYAEAEPLLTKVLEVRRRILGPEHPDTLISMSNLAILYQKQGKFAEAETFYTKILEVRRRILGPENRATTNVMVLLSKLRMEQQRYIEAESLLREALNGQEKSAPDSWQRYDSQSMLGASLAMQARFAEAEPLLVVGYNGLLQRKPTIPWEGRSALQQAAERLVRLYQDWQKPEKVAEWQARLKGGG